MTTKTKTKVEPSYTPVEECDWGLVQIMKGKYKGNIGEYDDDDIGSKIVVIPLGNPNLPFHVIIPRSHARKLTKKELKLFETW